MKTKLISVIPVILVIIAVMCGIGGFWWVIKTVSYVLFYESMVEATVLEILAVNGLML